MFKAIKWYFKTAFKIIRFLFRLFFGSEKAKQIKFNGNVVTDTNFVILNKAFAKDATTAYYKSRSFEYADVPTFEALDEHYAKDINKAYYCSEYREGQNYYLTKRQVILELKNADPTSFTSLENGYARDKANAWFEGVNFNVKDTTSLLSINRQFARDKFQAYLNLTPVSGSHGPTFEVIDGNFAKDENNVYYYGYTGDGASRICVLPYKPGRFRILDDRYSCDDIQVFFLGFKLAGSDPATFKILEEDYAKDQLAVFFREQKIEIADPGTFEVFPENGLYGHDHQYAKDKARIYMDTTPMPEADIDSFKILGENYACDSKNVYYKTRIVKGADPRSFRVYGHDVGNADSEDSRRKFHKGIKVLS
jgi:hypothetical protein